MNSNNIMIKGLIVAIMVLVMLIPIHLVRNLIEEREGSKELVDAEVSTKWGGKQQISGPVLVVPYEPLVKIYVGPDPKPITVLDVDYAYFLPDKMSVDADLQTEERGRTLFKSLVYQSEMKFSGSFTFPDIEQLHIDKANVKWDESFLLIGITDLQGVKNKIKLNVNGELLTAQPGVPLNDIISSGVTVAMPLDFSKREGNLDFNFDLLLNGSDELLFSAIAKEMQVNMTSDWETVSFIGSTFPSERDFTNGLTAKWDIFDYSANNVTAWKDSDNSLFYDSNFGVSLRVPVNQYQMNMRAVKYAIMFIALTFVAFFLVEILSRKRIHPMQYVLVSFALILFYTLLLSLSEHIGFGLSYLVSSAAIVLMVTLYSLTIFERKKHAAMMGIFLIMLYLFLYIVLQLENMALLFGSVGLFLALSAVMYVSRKVDWYKIGSNDNKPPKNKEIREVQTGQTPPPFTP